MVSMVFRTPAKTNQRAQSRHAERIPAITTLLLRGSQRTLKVRGGWFRRAARSFAAGLQSSVARSLAAPQMCAAQCNSHLQQLTAQRRIGAHGQFRDLEQERPVLYA